MECMECPFGEIRQKVSKNWRRVRILVKFELGMWKRCRCTSQIQCGVSGLVVCAEVLLFCGGDDVLVVCFIVSVCVAVRIHPCCHVLWSCWVGHGVVCLVGFSVLSDFYLRVGGCASCFYIFVSVSIAVSVRPCC